MANADHNRRADHRSSFGFQLYVRSRRYLGCFLCPGIYSVARCKFKFACAIPWCRSRCFGRDLNLADEFNPGPKRLHLCISRPCVDPSDEPKLHVTKIRVWAEADFVQAQLYVKDTMLKMIPAWKKLIKSGRGKGAKPGESGKETKEPQKKRRGDGQAKPKATPKRGGPPRKRRDPKADTPKERVPPTKRV